MLLKTGRADRPAIRFQTYRQGDVLVQKIDKLPADARAVECENRIVLQFGEVTGHCHAISTDTAAFYTARGERFVVTRPGGANLVHEEHGTIQLPEGVYRVVQQREYVPEAPPRDVID